MLRKTLACILGAISLSACNQWNALTTPQPDIKDDLWLKKSAEAELPTACRPANGSIDDWTFPRDKDDISKCTNAVKLLIDVKWGNFADGFAANVTGVNLASDLSVIGMNSAGALAGGTASQILNAISAGITGAKAKIDTDVLYNNSMLLIIQQMKSERALLGAGIIEKLEKTKSANTYTKGCCYRDMQHALNDLYDYMRAGSWYVALSSLQAQAGSKTTTNEKKLNKTKKDGGD